MRFQITIAGSPECTSQLLTLITRKHQVSLGTGIKIQDNHVRIHDNYVSVVTFIRGPICLNVKETTQHRFSSWYLFSSIIVRFLERIGVSC